MSKNPANTYETPTVSLATKYEGSASSSAERLTSTTLDLEFPSPTQYDIFDTILRCDAAASPELRLVDPTLARDVLLDKLSRARAIRNRANACDINDPISDKQLLEAYCDGADAYAGLLTLAPPLDNGNDQAMEAFYEWSQLAHDAVARTESRGTAPSMTIPHTPASLASDWDALSSLRETLAERAQFEHAKQYWDAAKDHDIERTREAFAGGDASRLDRAKALFHYAHELPEDAKALRVACLDESVAVIRDAVKNSERPHDDDLVGIYEYFMLQSMLGRSVHDIVWLEGQDTEDNRARSMSVQYLTNAADALGYVRYYLITAQEEPEEALRFNETVFDSLVEGDEELNATSATIDFLVAGLKDLRDAQGTLLGITQDPDDWPTKKAELDVAQKRVAYLKAKAGYEELEQKLAGQRELSQARLDTLHAGHWNITERLLAQRSKIIGNILPNTPGNHLAELVLDIDKQLNDARHFARIYEAECKEGAEHSYDAQQMGLSVMRLLQTIDDIKPNDALMNVSPTFVSP